MSINNNNLVPATITGSGNVSNVTKVKKAEQPDELSQEQIEELNKLADQSITALIKAKGDIFSTEADKITNVGLRDGESVSKGIQLMQEKMGNIFYNKEKSALSDNISKDITVLQNVLAKINPKDIENEAKYRIIRFIPFFGNQIVNILKQSSAKGMSLQEFVEHLEQSIQKGELDIRQDNAQLKVINDDLKAKKLIVSSNAYFAEVLIDKISEAVMSVEDEVTRNNLNEILARVSSRAQNIRATENILQQFFVSIKMTRTNNDYLLDAAREMRTNGVMVVNVSMAMHSALVRSKNVKDAVVGTGEFIGRMLEINSKLINNMVTEIGDIRKNPIIPMKMMENAVAQLEESIDKTNKLNVEVIEGARENRGKIKVWTEELRKKSGELANIEVKSLEAGSVLMLGEGSK